MSVYVVGTGGCAPSQYFENNRFENFVDTSDEWIKKRTGIHSRYLISGHQAVDLSAFATQKALEKAQFKQEDIDLIIVATTTGGEIFPSTACSLKKKLFLKESVPAFDLSAACSGFVFALDVAYRYLLSDAYETVLVVGTDTLSSRVNWVDRGSCILFGDAAGAVVLSKKEKSLLLKLGIH